MRKRSDYLIVRVRCDKCKRIFEARFDKEKEITNEGINSKRQCPYCKIVNKIIVSKPHDLDTIYSAAQEVDEDE